jgi:hypothetical protein
MADLIDGPQLHGIADLLLVWLCFYDYAIVH